MLTTEMKGSTGASAKRALKLFALQLTEHPAPSWGAGCLLSLSEATAHGKWRQEAGRENAGPRQGRGHSPSPVTAAECAVPMSAHTIGSLVSGDDWAHMNTVASSSCSSGEGSSAELI